MRQAKSILRQFLVPILLAVLVAGISVASFSKWAADRSSRLASATRMQSIGEVVSQGSYPKSTNVLENLQNLTDLDFVILRRETRRDTSGISTPSVPTPTIQASTLKLTPSEIKTLALPLTEKPWGVPVRWPWNGETGSVPSVGEGMIAGVTMRWIHLPIESGTLVVLESENHRGDSWFVFALPLVTGLLSLVGIALVAAWTAERLSRRIARLQAEVAEIANGNLVMRELEGPDDDVRSLQQSLYKMGGQLDESRKQIANNERSRLIHMLGSGLAHELRNHLTGARLALQTFTPPSSDEESIQVCLKQLDLAETQIRRLLAVRSDVSEVDQTPMNLQDIIQASISLVRPIAIHRNVRLDVFPPLPLALEKFDTMEPILVRSGSSMVGVIVNLLVNGIEAVGTGGEVKLRLHVDTSVQRIVWEVLDNGAGPEKEIAATMFEPFATTKREGVGLGLAMCRHVVESLGGSIRWERKESEDGKGEAGDKVGDGVGDGDRDRGDDGVGRNGWTRFEVTLPFEGPPM